MTLDTFFRKLRAFRGKFIILPSGDIREEDGGRCPIVCVKGGQFADNFCVNAVADDIGLGDDDSCEIIGAADNSPIRNKLRRRLLSTLGLNERWA